MKTFNKTRLVDKINYNGRTYTPNAPISATFTSIRYSLPKLLKTLDMGGQKAVLVQVLSKELKGKTDLYGKPYQPSLWIYTTN